MRSRLHHHRRATQELEMEGHAFSPAVAILHEVMYRLHLEKCRACGDLDVSCSTCAHANACEDHHRHNRARRDAASVLYDPPPPHAGLIVTEPG